MALPSPDPEVPRSLPAGRPAALSDNDLLAALDKLVEGERNASIEILDHLIEVDRRRVHVPMGYGSLYSYCTIHLGYSEGAACRRIYSARALRNFPRARRLLREGGLNLTTLSLIAGVLTKENERFVLAQATGASKRKVERIVARHNPRRTDPPDRVTPYAVVDPSAPNDTGEDADGRGREELEQCDENHRHRERCNQNNQHNQYPIFPFVYEPQPECAVRDRFMYEFTGSERFHQKFERARTLLSGKYPCGPSFEAVFEATLDSFIDKYCPARRAARRQQRRLKAEARKGSEQNDSSMLTNLLTNQPTKTSPRRIRSIRQMPIPIHDQVLIRDKFRCTYRHPSGMRCCCTWDLEVHHIVPKAKGGTDTINNLATLCVTHNTFMAERDFGTRKIETYKKYTDKNRKRHPAASSLTFVRLGQISK